MNWQPYSNHKLEELSVCCIWDDRCPIRHEKERILPATLQQLVVPSRQGDIWLHEPKNILKNLRHLRLWDAPRNARTRMKRKSDDIESMC